MSPTICVIGWRAWSGKWLSCAWRSGRSRANKVSEWQQVKEKGRE